MPNDGKVNLKQSIRQSAISAQIISQVTTDGIPNTQSPSYGLLYFVLKSYIF